MDGTSFEVDALEVPAELLDFDVAPITSHSPNFGPALRLFGSPDYPTQYQALDRRFVAELRGGYSNDRWRPSASRFGYTRNRGERLHAGVDIYAPLNTPLLSLSQGHAQMLPMNSGENIGHRVWLHTSINGYRYRLIYGHLSGFEGDSRDVSIGDVVGYVGCSGNADYGGICSEPNRCGFSASHVHLMAVREDGMRVDVSRLLNLPLRYIEDDRDVLCTELSY